MKYQIRGKRQSKYSSTLEGLRKLEDQLVSDRHAGIKISNNSAKLDDFFNVWCDTKRGIKDNTYAAFMALWFIQCFVVLMSLKKSIVI